jgi:hypothetical protein
MATPSCRIVWTGATRHHEFRELSHWLDQHASVTRHCHPTDAAAALSAPEAPPCELILIAQSRPGQFPQSVLESLHHAAPLTPLVGVLGSWCEGETRSGRPWKGIPRLYWHQLAPELARGLQQERRPGQPRWPQWQLPRTVTDSERALHASERLLPGLGITTHFTRASTSSVPNRPPRTWLVRTETVTQFETLADVLRCVQVGGVWWPPRRPTPPRAGLEGVIWDAEQLDDLEWSRLRELSRWAGRMPCIVLAGFPRAEEHEQLRRWGITSCLAKPLRIENLWFAIQATRSLPPEFPEARHETPYQSGDAVALDASNSS